MFEMRGGPFSPDVVQNGEPDLPVEQALHDELSVHALVLACDGTIRRLLPDGPVTLILSQEASGFGLRTITSRSVWHGALKKIHNRRT